MLLKFHYDTNSFSFAVWQSYTATLTPWTRDKPHSCQLWNSRVVQVTSNPLPMLKKDKFCWAWRKLLSLFFDRCFIFFFSRTRNSKFASDKLICFGGLHSSIHSFRDTGDNFSCTTLGTCYCSLLIKCPTFALRTSVDLANAPWQLQPAWTSWVSLLPLSFLSFTFKARQRALFK